MGLFKNKREEKAARTTTRNAMKEARKGGLRRARHEGRAG